MPFSRPTGGVTTRAIITHLDEAFQSLFNLEKFRMSFPMANLEDGQVLYCQNCKIESDPHPGDGNYIAIHVDKAGKECNVCHLGDLLEIHKRATAKLGQ